MKRCFIKTTDEDTANQLKKEGFQLLSKDGSVYTFINKETSEFKVDNKKISYSNILTF